ncbi:MAG: carbon monoxide dehydrogenase [Candidatus Marinimicrobia bacterium]|nr:carbon monoxide dehydrogenase [Candidatus Neomarinimicrobiota bacterium]
MYTFKYKRAASVIEAEKAFKAGEDAVFLAGGQTLIPTLKQRLAGPSDVIDIKHLKDLQELTTCDGAVIIGAGICHADVAASAEVQKSIPALSYLAQCIGDPQVRNCGTLGGSVANNDPASDYPAALLGLGATVYTSKREIAADDFFIGMFETKLEPGELILKVSFPIPKRASYAKFPNPASRYAVVGVMVAETNSGIRVAVVGAGPVVFRLPEMEAALSKSFTAEAINNIPISAKDLNEDLHATAGYRAHLVGVMAQRAVGSIT